MTSILGTNSNNNLVGMSGDDNIYGLLGNDTLLGYGGNDTLYGDTSPSEIQTLTPGTDGRYAIQHGTFISVTLSQFNFPPTEAQSLGYAILDASGAILSREMIVDDANTTERGSAIDINVENGVSLVFFTLPSSERSGFAWRPLDLNAVNTNIPVSNVTITVEEISSTADNHGNDNLYGDEGDDRLFGEGGNDYLIGGQGNDILSGGEGNDILWGENGDDHLHGGDGDDILQGQNGIDKLEGGAGNDSLYGGRGNDTLLAGDGTDYVRGQNGDDVIRGGTGDDELWGDNGDDIIRGDQGADYIEGGNGNDLLFGGAGKDEILGGTGDDDIRGNNGDDTIYGEGGNDTLRGNAGNDIIDGGEGNDWIFGNLGSNTLLGGNGNDYLLAGWISRDNLLDGGSGEDILIGGTHSDTLIFDLQDFQGQTEILPDGRAINQHIYDASTGFDSLRMSGSVHADFTGNSYQDNPNTQGNVIAGIEAVIGDSSHQTVTINIYGINAQSDTTDNDDWQGFVAWLGEGEDTLNLTGGHWQYDAADISNADITPAMIEKMALTTTQVSQLQAFVFANIYSDDQVTIWTDAENITYQGIDLL
ncbi:calcium-binding protein [Grimontia hollisae]|uniref:calcium-binding protein n=1 Tax=Grimontia hollisae TaxID=673 RepID=UPI00165E699E|nr:calcium-binding protein [Grimontia hollisae]